VRKSFVDYVIESGLEISQRGVLVLPSWVHRVKIDVGLSYSASNSIQWLRSDPNLLVLGFEPHPESRIRLRSHIASLADSTDLSRRLVVIPLALGSERGKANLHVTAQDYASSSLLAPKNYPTTGNVTVDVFRLSDVLKVIPFEKVGRVDYLKLDCQGMDLSILKGAGANLQRVALVTAEAENLEYLGPSNDIRSLVRFMQSQGFVWINKRSYIRIALGHLLSRTKFTRRMGIRLPVRVLPSVASSELNVIVEDPTFVNTRYAAEVSSGKISGFQQG
jgi:FkbM family methyltransferase